MKRSTMIACLLLGTALSAPCYAGGDAAKAGFARGERSSKVTNRSTTSVDRTTRVRALSLLGRAKSLLLQHVDKRATTAWQKVSEMNLRIEAANVALPLAQEAVMATGAATWKAKDDYAAQPSRQTRAALDRSDRQGSAG